MKKYTFSIVMAVYNEENYLDEAITSIINQSFPFEKVQLILVNDGSTDNSKEICLKYADMYTNIEYYEKENGGVSSARNYGLDYVKGEYVNFMDSDDILSEFALEKIYEFFGNNLDINLVGLVVKYFGNKNGIHPRYSKFEKETVIVDLVESPQNYVLSSAATFYRAELFKDLRFESSLKIAEDLYFNCQIYLDNYMFGIISADEAVYNYRIRSTNTSLSGQGKYDIDIFTYATEFLYDNFKRILDSKNMKMPTFLQHIMIGEIIKRTKALNSNSSDSAKKFYDVCKKVLNDIDEETIRKFYSSNHLLKVALLILKNGWDPSNLEYKIIDNRFYVNSVKVGIISRCPLIISKISFKNNKIKVEGVYNDIIPNNKNVLLRFKDFDLNTYNIKLEKTDNEFYVNRTLGFKLCDAYKIECELPIKNTVYKPYIKIAGMDIQLEFNSFYKFSTYENYLEDNEPFSLFSKRKQIEIDNHSLKVSDKNLLSQYIYETRKKAFLSHFYPDIIKYRKYNRKKKYIIINDRPMVANDNGQALFEYINKRNKKLASITYFAISKESPDYKKLKKIGNVVDIGSEKHKQLFINSKVIVSSHANFYNPFNELEANLLRDVLDYKFLFLQHGVIINDVHRPLSKPKAGIDLFVTSTENEQKEILSAKYMYDENDVILTGLPRFDKLVDKREKLIVVAPTWRTFLSGPINSDGFHGTVDGFEKSEYFKKWQSLLKNKKILDKCRKDNYRILFVLHPGFRNYFEHFKPLANDVIEVKHSEDIVYSELFNKLSLMVTDYSSIMFDVAYLKKPIIFYQFDKKMYFTKHYKPGYFSYEEDGFGKVLINEEDVVSSILNYFENGFVLESNYMKNIENTFKYIDKNNCKRVVAHLLKIVNKK